MSIELQDRIRDYASWVEAGQEPLAWDEIRHRHDEATPMIRPSPRRRVRGPWPALTAAAVVLVIFGVFMWVFPSDVPAPADALPPVASEGTAFYTTTAVPEGFVLQEIRDVGDLSMIYLNAHSGAWLPSDGGFSVTGIMGRPEGVPDDANGYLDATLEAVPGSLQIDLDGRPGVLIETEFSQGEVAAPLTWVLGRDDQGGVFEVVAIGMSRSAVTAVASGVSRIADDELAALGSQLAWDVQITTGHSDFVYATPSRVADLAEELEVAVGLDLLGSRLASASQGDRVIKDDDGEVVDTFGQAIRSTSVSNYLVVPNGDTGPAMRAYPSARPSPNQMTAQINDYINSIGGGPVLSTNPDVIQAVEGPEPRFDPSQLGEELRLMPVDTTEGLPIPPTAIARATEDRPVVIIGTVEQPGSDAPPVTGVLWFTPTHMTCVGGGTGDSMASGCGFLLHQVFGVWTQSTMTEYSYLDYRVPLDTSVVQIVTVSEDYWQRPRGGVGLVSFGDTIGRPSILIAYDVEGNEIGRWSS